MISTNRIDMLFLIAIALNIRIIVSKPEVRGDIFGQTNMFYLRRYRYVLLHSIPCV